VVFGNTVFVSNPCVCTSSSDIDASPLLSEFPESGIDIVVFKQELQKEFFFNSITLLNPMSILYSSRFALEIVL
jgi:hypothetical protein